MRPVMDASVIIPAYKASSTLPAALRSIETAAAAFDGAVETLVIDDPSGKGPSWARNRALEKASGDIVFFCDADDTVEPGFFRRPAAVLEATGADMCFFGYEGGPVLREETVAGPVNVRERYMPAFFGYSMDDVRRWNAGGALDGRKQPGQVWRCAFRRAFLEKHSLRFEEEMTFFEDAAFLSACIASAECVTSIPDRLYRYIPRPDGNLATGWRGERNWEYKFLSLGFRRRLDALHGGALWKYCEASCVFSALELLLARAGWRKYLADGRVVDALRAFPVSARHPAVAAAVLFLRAYAVCGGWFGKG